MLDVTAVAYKAVEEKAAAVVGHAGVPPPVAPLTEPGTVKKTRWFAVSNPTGAEIILAVDHVTVCAAEKVVSIKLPASGLMAYILVVTNPPTFVGHITVPPPVAVVMDAGAAPM